MTVVFQALTQTSGDAAGVLPRPRGAAYETSPNGAAAGRLGALLGHAVAADVGSAVGVLPRLRSVSMEAAGAYVLATLPRLLGLATGGAAAPSVALGYGTLPPLIGAATGFSTSFGDAAGTLPRPRSLALQQDGYSAGVLPQLSGLAYQVTPPSSFVTLLQSPGYLAITGLGAVQQLATLTDQLQLADTPTPDFIHALLDLITFSDRYTQLAQVLQALSDGMSMADVAAMLWQADLLDSFIASGVPAGMAQITVLLADTFDVSDAPTALSEILAAIADGFYVTLTLNSGADTYTAWVMTPETKAMRSYSNFPFNSYAMLGGQFLGVGAAGIYRMGGTTDAGAAIRSAIRTGLLSFGSQGMKAVSRAYLGATTSGALLLRVQATTQTGADIEQTYRMVPAVTNVPREHRVDVGRGFRSVYWTFELANDTDGATFEVHNWHVLPVSLTRRLI